MDFNQNSESRKGKTIWWKIGMEKKKRKNYCSIWNLCSENYLPIYFAARNNGYEERKKIPIFIYIYFHEDFHSSSIPIICFLCSRIKCDMKTFNFIPTFECFILWNIILVIKWIYENEKNMKNIFEMECQECSLPCWGIKTFIHSFFSSYDYAKTEEEWRRIIISKKEKEE